MKIFTNLFNAVDRSCAALDNAAKLLEVSTDVAAKSVSNWGKIQNAELAKDYAKAVKDLPDDVKKLIEEANKS